MAKKYEDKEKDTKKIVVQTKEKDLITNIPAFLQEKIKEAVRRLM